MAGYQQRVPDGRRRDRGDRRPVARSGGRSRTGSGPWPASTTTTARCWRARRRPKRLDFVDIATPPSEHAEVAHAALDRGLHVLCEKPLATTTEDARAMLRHAVRAERVLYPCHNYKHAPVIKAVRAILDAGRIGKVHLVTLQTFRNTHARASPAFAPTGDASGATRAAASRWTTAATPSTWPSSGCAATRPRSRRARRRWGRSTPRTTSPAACAFRPASPRRTCRGTPACARCSTPFTATHGAVRVEDDGIEVATQNPAHAARRATPRLELRTPGDRVRLDGLEPRRLVQLAVRRLRGGDRRGASSSAWRPRRRSAASS